MHQHPSAFSLVQIHLLRQLLGFTLRTFNPRLWLMVLAFLAVFALHHLILRALRMIDAIFYTGYRQTVIKAPVFIIANPRSGTTYLQKLIRHDSRHYTAMYLLDTLFPAVCFHKFVRYVRRIDRLCGDPLARLLGRLDRVFFKGWDGIHQIGFMEPEEDENLFVLALISPGWCLLFPFLHHLPKLHMLDACSPQVRAQVMDFYEDCLKRFVFATGCNKTYLAKNVLSSGRIRSLYERFPDAKVLYIVRNPSESLPSFVSMFSAMYPVHSPHLPTNAPAYRAWAQVGIDFYHHCLNYQHEVAPDAFYTLRFEDLIQRPSQVVAAAFRFFGWPLSAEMHVFLAQEDQRQAGYRSKHHYNLEQYGLSEASIHEQLADLFERYGFVR